MVKWLRCSAEAPKENITVIKVREGQTTGQIGRGTTR